MGHIKGVGRSKVYRFCPANLAPSTVNTHETFFKNANFVFCLQFVSNRPATYLRYGKLLPYNSRETPILHLKTGIKQYKTAIKRTKKRGFTQQKPRFMYIFYVYNGVIVEVTNLVEVLLLRSHLKISWLRITLVILISTALCSYLLTASPFR